MPELSVVIPAYNEAENLQALADELWGALESLGATFEVIIVDDGSVDGTFEILKSLRKKYPGLEAIRLARNYGQTAAMAAAIERARGNILICLDADLQNDPKDIPRLLAKLQEGYDVVSGWRKNRQDPWLTRRLPSQIANQLISWIMQIPLHDYGCTLKAYKREFIQPVRLFGEMHRFMVALSSLMGARITEVEVAHHPRRRGASKYGLIRTFKVILDLITVKFMDAYMTKPIYLFGGWGLLMGFAGAAMSAVVLYKKFFMGIFVKDQPLFQVSIFFELIGFQMIFLGLLAEITVRTYYDIKDKPIYFIREVAGSQTPQADSVYRKMPV